MLSNYFCKKHVLRGTFLTNWRIQIQIYPQTPTEPKYGAFYFNNKVSAHGLVLLVQLSWRVASYFEFQVRTCFVWIKCSVYFLYKLKKKTISVYLLKYLNGNCQSYLATDLLLQRILQQEQHLKDPSIPSYIHLFNEYLSPTVLNSPRKICLDSAPFILAHKRVNKTKQRPLIGKYASR